MASARARRDGAPRADGVDQGSAGFHATADWLRTPEVAPLSLPIQQKLLLRTLVERFGGEVLASNLTRSLSQERSWALPAMAPGYTEFLGNLQRLGAVDLEPIGDSDLIVRLLPVGAELYA